MLRCYYLLLGGLLSAEATWAQLPGPATPDTSAAACKGAIWTRTAARIWADRHLTLAKPPAWDTDRQVYPWLLAHDKQDKSGLGNLRTQVFSYVKQHYQAESATPPQLAAAILATLKQDNGVLKKVSAENLQQALAALASVPPASVAGGPDTTTASLPTTRTAVAASPAPLPAAPYPAAPTPTNSYVARYPILVLGGTALLSAVLGALAMAFWLGRRQAESRAKLERKIHKLEKHSTALTQEIERLKRPRAAQPPATPAEAPAAPAAPASVPPTPEPPTEAVADTPEAAPPEPPAPAIYYAALQADGFLEASRLKPDPTPQHTLQITVSTQHPGRASFALNPTADLQTLIEYRLDILRHYFDFTLPAGRPTTLSTHKPGQLVRNGDGWRVAANGKGQLDVR